MTLIPALPQELLNFCWWARWGGGGGGGIKDPKSRIELMLNFEKLRALMPLFVVYINLKTYKLYLISGIMGLVARNQIYSRFS